MLRNRRANRFLAGIRNLKIEEMEKVWAKDADIQCGHPG